MAKIEQTEKRDLYQRKSQNFKVFLALPISAPDRCSDKK